MVGTNRYKLKLTWCLYCLAFINILLLSKNVAASDISVNGFFQGNYSGGLNANPDGGDFKLADERFQLKLAVKKEPFKFFIKTDTYLDNVVKKGDIDVRELYFDYVTQHWDSRVGRQIITWGVGDLIFINDVFPKNYNAFFSGYPMEYMKKGIDGVKIGLYPDFASLDVVVIPFFEPNSYPDPERFQMYDSVKRDEEKPVISLKNTELAFRLYKNISGTDISLYYYHGFYRQPSLSSDNQMTLIYPRLTTYGMSLQTMGLDGILSFEAGYYDSVDDRGGTDLMTPNSQTKFLAGYQKQLWEDFTAGLQYYCEYMNDYSEYEKTLVEGYPKEKQLKNLISVRLTQILLHQTLRLSFFSFWGISDNDYLINPEIKYNFTDHIWAAVGANVFGGQKKWTQFGQFDKNDNVYVQLRYEF
ncbi:MAG: hypothetical protein H7844_00530 [Nitrospirae bacterium YQR-1]